MQVRKLLENENARQKKLTPIIDELVEEFVSDADNTLELVNGSQRRLFERMDGINTLTTERKGVVRKYIN